MRFPYDFVERANVCARLIYGTPEPPAPEALWKPRAYVNSM